MALVARLLLLILVYPWVLVDLSLPLAPVARYLPLILSALLVPYLRLGPLDLLLRSLQLNLSLL